MSIYYSSGYVQVRQGDTTVTGTSVDFSTIAGDSSVIQFDGDFERYEIAEFVSDRVLRLAKPYEGGSALALGYAIVTQTLITKDEQSFASRDELVAWLSVNAPSLGVHYRAGGVTFVGHPVLVSVIPDMPGVLPLGTYTPQHFGAKGDFEWSAMSGHDDTVSIRRAFATGKRVFVPRGDYRITDEIPVTTPGQIIEFETTGGYGYGEDIGKNWVAGTRFVGTGVFPKRVRTRRGWRGDESDPQDAPLSVMINNQAEGAVLANVSVFLWCDYTIDLNEDESPNLGADCDVGIFNGCRVGLQARNHQAIGYFRYASVLLDFTQLVELPRHPDLNGQPYADGTVKNGADGIKIDNGYCRGGRQGLAILGAKPAPDRDGYAEDRDYYDAQLGIAVRDRRGSFGHSDLTLIQGRYYGPDHHSGLRLYDPNGGAGFLSEATLLLEPDDAPCALHIDGMAGNSSGAGWGFNCFAVRFSTFEGFRVRLDRAARVFMSGCHIEGRNGGRMDSSGNVINTNDYDHHTYGQISGTSYTSKVTVVGGTTTDDDYLFPHFYGTRPFYQNEKGEIFGVKEIEFQQDLSIVAKGTDTLAVEYKGLPVLDIGAAGVVSHVGRSRTIEVLVSHGSIVAVPMTVQGGNLSLSAAETDLRFPQIQHNGLVSFDVGLSLSITALAVNSALELLGGPIDPLLPLAGKTTLGVGPDEIQIRNESGSDMIYALTIM